MRSRRVTVPDRSGRAFGIVVEARLQTVSKNGAMEAGTVRATQGK